MLAYNDIKPGVAVLVDGEPYVCTWNNIMKKQQRRPVNQTKLRHIIKGNSIEYSFQQSDKVEEAEIETRPAVFIYERNRRHYQRPNVHQGGRCASYQYRDGRIRRASLASRCERRGSRKIVAVLEARSST